MKSYQYLEIEYGTPEYDLALSLRYKILREPLNLEYTQDQIADEYDQLHFGAFDENDNLLACLSYQIKDSKTLKMRQVAVLDSFQRTGVGTSLVLYTEVWAKCHNYEKIILHARDVAVPFYLKLGYKKTGKPFMEVGISHYFMEKNL